MPKYKEITVESEFKLGFDHSFSSVAQRHAAVIILEPGDKEADVRKAERKRLEAMAYDDCARAKKKYDVKKPGGVRS